MTEIVLSDEEKEMCREYGRQMVIEAGHRVDSSNWRLATAAIALRAIQSYVRKVGANV